MLFLHKTHSLLFNMFYTNSKCINGNATSRSNNSPAIRCISGKPHLAVAPCTATYRYSAIPSSIFAVVVVVVMAVVSSARETFSLRAVRPFQTPSSKHATNKQIKPIVSGGTHMKTARKDSWTCQFSAAGKLKPHHDSFQLSLPMSFQCYVICSTQL